LPRSTRARQSEVSNIRALADTLDRRRRNRLGDASEREVFSKKKRFFFEKKKQKTFIHLELCHPGTCAFAD